MEKLEFTKLKRNLTALVEFSRVVNSSLDLQFTLNNLLLTCLGKFITTRGCIILSIQNELKILSSKGISEAQISSFPIIPHVEEIEESKELKDFLYQTKLIYSEKICSPRKCLGILCLGEKINKEDYSAEEKEFLVTILNIASTAIENAMFISELKDVNRMLDSRVNRLSSLFELGKEFGVLNDESRISKLLVYSLLGHFLLSTYVVLILDENKLKILESTVPKAPLLDVMTHVNIQSIENVHEKEGIEKDFPNLSKYNFELMIPMQLQGETRGLVLLGKRMNNIPYSETDIEFINSVGTLAIISLENKRLFQEALEKQKLEEELEIAKGIQRNLFPKEIPQLNNFQISAISISSKQVGGDYYDVIKAEDGRYFIGIGDVSGKGVPASLLMANLQAFLKSITKQGYDIAASTRIINDLVSENTTDGRFITFFWLLLDDQKKEITYVNAGHNPPLLIRDKKITYLDKGGMLLGVMKSFIPYESETVQLEKNDILVMFTDGVTEAKNRDDEEFSDQILEKILTQKTFASSDEILSEIKRNIDEFVAGEPQSDDITMITILVT
ncbi:MAG: SpoIIE family protein phosphatase [Ignavibacteriaceae bacterium]|nr:SpoIIE family protein phosphatase [Ignavibacteriaceae bacterium]